MKMGAMGKTLVASSGDDGAPGNLGLAASCDIKELDPLFPAASPYVTTVGGTMLTKGKDESGEGVRVGSCPKVPLPQCGDYCEDDVMCGKGFEKEGACGTCVKDTNTCGAACGAQCKKDDDCAAMKCPICGDDKHPNKCIGFSTDPARNETLEVRRVALHRRSRLAALKTLSDRRSERHVKSQLPPGCPDPLCIENDGCATGTQEVAASIPGAGITTGGGFSGYASRPSYQQEVVQSYLTQFRSLLPPSDSFNSSGRAFPDVAAVANNYAVWMGMWLSVDGTSAAAPVFAGILASIAAKVREVGGPSSLGFANPMLYKLAASKPGAFTDVVEGNNKCTSKCCATIGYTATKGWDPVTGLGSPNVKELTASAIRLVLGDERATNLFV